MMIAGIESVETAGNVANLLFSLSLIFCGVLQSSSALPRFWIFMYRVCVPLIVSERYFC